MTETNQTRRTLLAAAGAMAALFAARASAQAKKLDPVNVANNGIQFTYGPFYVALHGGFFAEQGIEIHETSQNATAISISSVLNGDSHFGLGPSDQVAITVARKQPLRAVALLVSGFPNVIVLRKSVAEEITRTTGVTQASSVADKARVLKGKTFALTSAGSPLESVLYDQARKGGLNPDNDLTVSYTGSGAGTFAALKSGRVDGAVTGFPFSIQAFTENISVKWIDTTSAEVPELHGMDFSTMFTSQRLIQSNPDLVQRMVNAIAKAQSYLQTNKNQSRELLRKVFPSMTPQVLDLAFDTIYPLFAKTPAGTEQGFAKAETLLNKTLQNKINVAFADAVDNRFAAKAAGIR